ncbi:MFS transporter [Legionella nagasakiensis]|uniref:MFS transporter n=1 Tax=Legionella nagasakiensis TaxID=535290 RepID=UPI001056CF02|nr:MFS transporter [Legionella nagasakiensis]
MKQWPMILALILTYIIFAILLNSVGAVILQVIHHYGVSKQHASTLEGFKDLPIAIISFLFASFLPRLGYKSALQMSLFLVAFACFAMPFIPTFLTTQIHFLILGVSFALVKVSIYASIGIITRNQQQHASLLNTVEGFFMVGVLLGNWLFSLFIHDSGSGNNEWLTVYWLLGGLCVINLFLLHSTAMPNVKMPNFNTFLYDFKRMLNLIAHSLVLVFILSTFIYVLIEQSISTWLPTFNHEILQFPRTMSVQAASIFAASLALGRLLAGILLRKMPWYHLLTGCVLAMAVLMIVILPATQDISIPSPITWQTAPLATFLLPLVGFFMAPIYPAISSVMLSTLPKSQHAAMTGLIVIFSALGGTTGSLLTGNLFNAFGGQKAFYLLLLPLTLLYFTIHGFRHYSQRTVIG